MKKYIKIAGLLSLSAATLFGAGYKIPEQSLNSTALSAAYVANAKGADASYYNPANMAFSRSGSDLEIVFTYIRLPEVTYIDNGSFPSKVGVSASDAKSNTENFYVPTFHYMSSEYNKWRFGLSFVAPAGLSKQWSDAFPKSSAQEFTLKVLELNPTASYKINDKFAVGFGLRGVYTSGIVKATSAAVVQDLKGNSVDFGYNLALSYKPIEDLTLSSTYRSKVDLTITGNANGHIGAYLYDTDASVKIPLPAALTFAAAYSFNKTTIELVYERTYWSSYKNLDFNYADATVEATLGAPKPKNWKDVNAYRLGITHQYNDKLKLMAGFAVDKSPVPDNTLAFELPDSDAKLYSVGFEYKINKQMKIGLSYLYDSKKSRTVAQGAALGKLNGTFSDGGAHLLTASFKYRF
ncbi:MAG: transporter [Epsilonproteobacteria bacterium]|nr:transporter [Campylobacterota bacterium]